MRWRKEIIRIGWDKDEWFHSILFHAQLIDGKVIIEAEYYPINSPANLVNRRVASILRIAIPIAFVVPIITTVLFARVRAV